MVQKYRTRTSNPPHNNINRACPQAILRPGLVYVHPLISCLRYDGVFIAAGDFRINFTQPEILGACPRIVLVTREVQFETDFPMILGE